MKAVALTLALIACSSGGNDDGAKLKAAFSPVHSELADLTLLFSEYERSVEAARARRGSDNTMGTFEKLLKELVELHVAVTNQPRLTTTGDLSACTATWYGATDAIKDALDPVVRGFRQMGTLDDYMRARIEYEKASSKIKTQLCGLAAAGKQCDAALKSAGVTSSLGWGGPLGCP